MYIPPRGQIELYAGVPLRDDYENTFTFKTATAQHTYFNSKLVFLLDEQMYTRKSSGKIRVAKSIYALQNIDYLSFINKPTEISPSRRYYCFVTNIDYVNESASDITFTIDVMQTYLFDITFKTSFITRKHVTVNEDDVMYRNAEFKNAGPLILDDDLEIGEYYFKHITFGNTQYPDFFGQPYVYIVAATFDKNFADAVGGLQNGFYSGLKFNVFDNVNDINNFLLNAASRNKADGIVNVYMAPKFFAENPSAEQNEIMIDVDAFNDIYTDDFDYVPRNKILYNAPFCKIVWTNNDGTTGEYAPNYFTNAQLEDGHYYWIFNLTWVCAGCNEVSVFPVDYKGTGNNYNEQVVMNVTPQCAYATDSYRAWLAQNNAKMSVAYNQVLDEYYLTKDKMFTDAKHQVWSNALTGISNILTTALSAQQNTQNAQAAGTTTNAGKIATVANASQAAGAVNAMIQGYHDTLSNVKILKSQAEATIGTLNAAYSVARTVPPQAHGAASGMAGSVNGTYRLSCYLCVPNEPRLRKLDTFFDMYGYKVNSLEVPNIKTRKYWNYIKCASFNAEGTFVPGAHYDLIKTIYERGLTFWHDTQHFLDYSQNNHQAYV